MWTFSGGGFLSRVHPLIHRQIVVSQARVVLVLVELLFLILWSGLCFALQWGSGRGKRLILWLTSLPWMRNIDSGIRLRIESSRGLGLGCLVGCFLSGQW